MATVQVSIDINADKERVYEAFTDLHNAAERIEGIQTLEVLTDGPLAVGTRFKETRIMFGKEATEEMEFTELNPPNGYVVEASSHGSHYRSIYEFETTSTGTQVTMSFISTPLNFMAKVMTAIMGKMMKKMVTKCLVADMEDLKIFCEQSAA